MAGRPCQIGTHKSALFPSPVVPETSPLFFKALLSKSDEDGRWRGAACTLTPAPNKMQRETAKESII
ncbi:hypothetical protein WG66_002058 [Moniliophthora roreri]|nr:hypothetical protein WG66_002058 [Moniliophthora roreri]